MPEAARARNSLLATCLLEFFSRRRRSRRSVARSPNKRRRKVAAKRRKNMSYRMVWLRRRTGRRRQRRRRRYCATRSLPVCRPAPLFDWGGQILARARAATCSAFNQFAAAAAFCGLVAGAAVRDVGESRRLRRLLRRRRRRPLEWRPPAQLSSAQLGGGDSPVAHTRRPPFCAPPQRDAFLSISRLISLRFRRRFLCPFD